MLKHNFTGSGLNILEKHPRKIKDVQWVHCCYTARRSCMVNMFSPCVCIFSYISGFLTVQKHAARLTRDSDSFNRYLTTRVQPMQVPSLDKWGWWTLNEVQSKSVKRLRKNIIIDNRRTLLINVIYLKWTNICVYTVWFNWNRTVKLLACKFNNIS